MTHKKNLLKNWKRWHIKELTQLRLEVRWECTACRACLRCPVPSVSCSRSRPAAWARKTKNIFKTLKQFLETIDKEFEIRIQHLKETHKLKECLVYWPGDLFASASNDESDHFVRDHDDLRGHHAVGHVVAALHHCWN